MAPGKHATIRKDSGERAQGSAVAGQRGLIDKDKHSHDIKRKEVIDMDLRNRTDLRTPKSAVELRLLAGGARCDGSQRVLTAAERFFQAAGQCGDGGYLGWQLTASEGRTFTVAAFSDREAQAAPEDLAWIFGSCAAAVPLQKDPLAGFFREGQRVYALGSAPGAGKGDEGYLARQRRRAAEYGAPPDHVAELLEALSPLAGALRLLAGGEGGTILISLPGSMSLRLRTMLSLAFPGTEVVPWAGSDDPQPPCLPQDRLAAAMTDLLEALLSRAGAEPACQEEELLGDDEFDDEPGDDGATAPPAPHYTDMLDSLIGLDGVKEQVRRIAAYARMKRDMAARRADVGPIVLNMAFVGNPGTAKTTVARIMAGILWEQGLLKSSEPVEVGRADLIAQYEGQTAVRVRNVFERALGKLLFIDEAYSLLEYSEGAYGDEAISTIVQEMENRRTQTVVVFAGYPDKMETFFNRNPGLRSRVPFMISFPDYSPEEMVKITEAEAEKRGFVVSASAKQTVATICQRHDLDAGNGRLCRNMVEDAILSFAARVYGDDPVLDSAFVLTAADFSTKFQTKQRQRGPIGFRD